MLATRSLLGGALVLLVVGFLAPVSSRSHGQLYSYDLMVELVSSIGSGISSWLDLIRAIVTLLILLLFPVFVGSSQVLLGFYERTNLLLRLAVITAGGFALAFFKLFLMQEWPEFGPTQGPAAIFYTVAAVLHFLGLLALLERVDAPEDA